MALSATGRGRGLRSLRDAQPLTLNEHLSTIEADAARIRVAYDTDRSGRIPWSDRWTVRTVARHVARAHHLVAGIIHGRPTADFGLVDSIELPAKDDPGFPAWFEAGTERAVRRGRSASARCSSSPATSAPNCSRRSPPPTPEHSIDDYAERTAQIIAGQEGMNGQQPGDPAKLADAAVSSWPRRRTRRGDGSPEPTPSPRSSRRPANCSPKPTPTGNSPATSHYDRRGHDRSHPPRRRRLRLPRTTCCPVRTSPARASCVRAQVEAYERSGGTEANTLRDLGIPVIIVTIPGAKTGDVRKIALMRVEHDGEYTLLVTVLGGAPKHPVWYWNLTAHPTEVLIQDGPEPFRVTVREVEGDERARRGRTQMITVYPPYAEYQEGAPGTSSRSSSPPPHDLTRRSHEPPGRGTTDRRWQQWDAACLATAGSSRSSSLRPT